MRKNFKIANKVIGQGKPTYIVAELSGNHNQSYGRAVKIVEAACRAGVDAIKLQTYTPDTLTINCDNRWFQVKGTNKEWMGQTLYGLYRSAYTPWEWQPKLKKVADKYGVALFSSPFDETAVDFLEKMEVPAYKVASFEIGDLELLKKIGSTKRPVIMSRGMANIKEIRLAIETLKKNGTRDIVLLHCISSYPASPEEMNISTIPALERRLGVLTGFSDHTLGIDIAIAAVSLGAKLIEKHVTMKRSDGGPDAAFSLEPHELEELVKSVRRVEKSIGMPRFGACKRESTNLVFRRSLFAVEDIKNDEVFTNKNIRSIRPGYGLQPKFLRKILGKRAKRSIKRGTPLSWELII